MWFITSKNIINLNRVTTIARLDIKAHSLKRVEEYSIAFDNVLSVTYTSKEDRESEWERLCNTITKHGIAIINKED